MHLHYPIDSTAQPHHPINPNLNHQISASLYREVNPNSPRDYQVSRGLKAGLHYQIGWSPSWSCEVSVGVEAYLYHPRDISARGNP